jgi:hypothetical protein
MARMRSITIRLPPLWHQLITEEAERMGVSTAHYIREAGWMGVLARSEGAKVWSPRR